MSAFSRSAFTTSATLEGWGNGYQAGIDVYGNPYMYFEWLGDGQAQIVNLPNPLQWLWDRLVLYKAMVPSPRGGLRAQFEQWAVVTLSSEHVVGWAAQAMFDRAKKIAPYLADEPKPPTCNEGSSCAAGVYQPTEAEQKDPLFMSMYNEFVSKYLPMIESFNAEQLQKYNEYIADLKKRYPCFDEKDSTMSQFLCGLRTGFTDFYKGIVKAVIDAGKTIIDPILPVIWPYLIIGGIGLVAFVHITNKI